MKIVENYDSILYRYDKNSYRNALHKFLLRAVNRCKIVGRRDIFTKENSSQRRRQTSVFDFQSSRYLRVDVERVQESRVMKHRSSHASLDVDAPCNNLLHEVSIVKRMDV